MDLRFYEEADVAPFQGNIDFLDKITLVMLLNTLSDNIMNKNVQLVIYSFSFFLLNFF